MSDGHGPDSFLPPPPVVAEPVVYVVEGAQVTHSDHVDVLHLTRADGAAYSVVLPPLRNAQKPDPGSVDTELTE